MIETLIIIIVISLQTFFGYIENKLLGAILPIAVIVADIYFLANGLLQLSFRDIAMPIIGLLTLISLWEGGRQSKLSKQKREMQKMKAQDSKHHD